MRTFPWEKIGRIAGFAFIAISVVGGFLVHPAVGVGLALLAGIRIWILRREERSLAVEATNTPLSPQRPRRRKATR